MVATLKTLLLAALSAALTPVVAGVSPDREWRFEVFLDDKPIGFHRFLLSSAGDTHQLESDASFRVTILGLTVYDYRHRSLELWQDDCLQRIDASTDDNGKDFFVRGSGDSDRLRLETNTGKAGLRGCVMTFAYWNPAILAQQRLLNAQTGDYLAVTVEQLGEKTLPLRGREVPALHYRISTGERDIELWYSSERDWLGLSSTTRGGRQLHYRRVAPAVATESVSGG